MTLSGRRFGKAVAAVGALALALGASGIANAAVRTLDPLTAPLTPPSLCDQTGNGAMSMGDVVTGGQFGVRDTVVQGLSQRRFLPGTGWTNVPISRICASIGGSVATFVGTKINESTPAPGQRNYLGQLLWRNAGGAFSDLTGIQSISLDFSATGPGFYIEVTVYDTVNQYQRYFSTVGPVSGSGTLTVTPADLDPQSPPNPVFTDWSQIAAVGVNVYSAMGDTLSISLSNLKITDDDPEITSFTPTAGFIGSTVVITGTNFTGATSVAFNGVPATTYTVDSATQITAVVPLGATAGPISVTTPLGSTTSATSFTFIPSPTITSFTPTEGLVGSTVVITGTNFNGATAVRFNGVSAPLFTLDSPTQITVTVPGGSTTGPISVTNPAGTGTSTGVFTVLPIPRLQLTSLGPTTLANPSVSGGGVPNTVEMKFRVTRTATNPGSLNRTTTVNWQTSGSTALGCGSIPATNAVAPYCNYRVQTPTLLTFAPGETVKEFSVFVVGAPEIGKLGRRFRVVLAGANGGQILRPNGITIKLLA